MKLPSNLTLGSLVLAIASSVYGQDNPAASTSIANSPPPAAAPTTPALVRFDGTDLHIGSMPPISFHGFASQGYLASTKYNYIGGRTTGDGSFRFNEFGLNASMSPFPHMRISAQAFAFDAGNVGNDTPVLDYAMADYNVNQTFGIRAGRIRRPEGIYNDVQDLDLGRTSVLLPQGMYDARWRDFTGTLDGGSLYGDIPLSKAGDLSYEVYGGHVELSQEGGISRLLQDGLDHPPYETYGEVNGFATMGGQLWWHTPIDGLRAGAAFNYDDGFGYTGSVMAPTPFGLMTFPLNGSAESASGHFSLEYQIKSWTFQAELKEESQVARTSVAGNIIQRSQTRPETWYVSGAYRFNKWLELGTYYTEYYTDAANRSGTTYAAANPGMPSSDASQKDVALSLRFDPTPWWIIKVEGHHLNGTALLDNNGLNPVRNGNGWWMLAVKSTFSF